MPKVTYRDLTTSELIRRCYTKRREILKTLKPELLAEYRRLGRMIRDLRAEQADRSPIGPPPKEGLFQVPRIPLFTHKQKLIEFLRTRESATRVEIVTATGIPTGSLSSLLKGNEFEQVRHGFWALKKGDKEKPGTSAPTAK